MQPSQRLGLGFGESHRPGGVRGIYRAMRACLNRWEAEYEPDHRRNPIRRVPPPRAPDEVLEPADLDALRAMLRVRPARTLTGARDRAMPLFFLDTGVRRQAMVPPAGH